MSRNEEDFSAYMVYQSTMATICSALSGFIFTAITILLTPHPEPSLITAQVALFTLTAVLNIFGLLMYRASVVLGFCVKVAPKLPEAFTRGGRTYDFLATIGRILLGWIVVLMFFLWNLLYLALASGVVTALSIIFSYITTTKASLEFLKEHPLTRK